MLHVLYNVLHSIIMVCFGFSAITNDVFDVGMPISGKTKEQGIWQVIQRNSIIKSNFSAFFVMTLL